MKAVYIIDMKENYFVYFVFFLGALDLAGNGQKLDFSDVNA